MTRSKLLSAAVCLTALAFPTFADDPIEVIASQDLSVRRGDDNSGPVKEAGLHPKTVSEKEKNKLDRFALIRFDSEDFGKDVRAVELTIQAKDEGTNKGRQRFRVYGVRDGDEQDEKFTEKEYKPDAEGTLFDDSRNMLDRRQVAVLGTFTCEPGETVKFNSATLTALVRSDDNGTVTLVIIRETESGENSAFHDRKSTTPPTLRIAKKKD